MFHRQMRNVLALGHGQAWAIGRTLDARQSAATAQKPHPTALDLIHGAQQAKLDEVFLLGFMADIAIGRYVTYLNETTGQLEQSPAAITARAFLYVHRFYNSVQEAWIQERLPMTSVRWFAQDDNHVCPDCAMLAANGPYLIAALPTVPAGGATECGTHCRCWLEEV
jgi:hypothetical protein